MNLEEKFNAAFDRASYSEALCLVEELLKNDEYDAEYNFKKGFLLVKECDYSLAFIYLSRAIEYSMSSPDYAMIDPLPFIDFFKNEEWFSLYNRALSLKDMDIDGAILLVKKAICSLNSNMRQADNSYIIESCLSYWLAQFLVRKSKFSLACSLLVRCWMNYVDENILGLFNELDFICSQ